MSTISGTVTTGVTLGQAGYTSPLTITANGYVENTGTGATVFASGTYANPTVVNMARSAQPATPPAPRVSS
jgi:hypothetical protein